MNCLRHCLTNYWQPLPVVETKTTQKNVIHRPDGRICEGEMVNSLLNGQGNIVYLDGMIEEGEFIDDILNGVGKRTITVSGHIFKGEFKHGQLNGQGSITSIDGTTSIGEFKNNELNGYGKIIYPNGGMYEGFFVEDILHGPGCVSKPALFDNPAEYEEGIYADGILEKPGGVYKSASGKTRILPEN